MALNIAGFLKVHRCDTEDCMSPATVEVIDLCHGKYMFRVCDEHNRCATDGKMLFDHPTGVHTLVAVSVFHDIEDDEKASQ